MAKKTETLTDSMEIDVERLIAGIEEIERVGKMLQTTKLKEKAVLVLLSHHTKLPQKTISDVLQGLVDLKRVYLK